MEITLVENTKRVVGDALDEVFSGATSARVAVAFARDSGLERATGLKRLASDGRDVRFLAGVDFQQTDLDTLDALASGPKVESRIYCLTTLRARTTFHPKMYLAVAGGEFRALVGSSNFTGGGLATNLEANLQLRGSIDHHISKQLLGFHDELWSSPMSVPVSPSMRATYARLQEKRRLISADLQRDPDFERARAATDYALREAAARFVAPE